MKKTIYILLLSALGLLFSCGKQDTVYKQFVVDGGRIYPAKPVNAVASAGFCRILVRWEAPMDPSLRTAKLFWDNYTQSREFNYSDYPDGVIETVIDNLEDRAYTFNIVNYDGAGNASLSEEVTTSPFGDGWLVSHAERSLVSALVDEFSGNATVTMTQGTDEMVATKFRYRKNNGETVESEVLKPEDNVIVIPDVMPGKSFEFISAYCPSEGVDTVWASSWSKSRVPFCYNVDRSRASVTVTSGQVRDAFYPSLILDGIKDDGACRWFSSNAASNRNTFPKILVIDTHLTGANMMTFTNFTFYMDPAADAQTRRYIRAVNVYVSETALSPDDSNYSRNWGEPVLSVSLNQNEAVQSFVATEQKTGRYVAIVFRNSYNSSGFIDLWEFEAHGFLEADID
ncbi:MAG: hypothetical protein IJ222_00480 [Bacteroidales bacterium]|nr:hypothetical protein [Bacteroidales bacterium]